MAEDLGEKTEMPTSRRRQQARGRGQVAKSHDFGSAFDLAGGFILLGILGSSMVGGMAAVLRHLLDSSVSGVSLTFGELDASIRWSFLRMLVIAGPFLLIMFTIAFFAQFSQVGLMFTLQPIQPNLNKLNPLSGFKKLLSKRNAVRTVTGGSKMALLAVIAYLVVRGRMMEVVSLPRLGSAAAFAVLLDVVRDLCIWLLVILFIMGIADLIYQRWHHTKDLKMTKQEVKDEMRSMEGDMETKGRRLRMARQIALQRMQQAVPKADVVVTNPTHFSVALQYDGANMPAPRVVAKGVDFMAFRIREIASANGVPIVERPPLARALYAGVDVGQSIKPEYYEAVAEILAYVYRMEGRQPTAA